MSDVLNPVAVEQRILEVSNRIANGVKICSDLYEAYLDAEHAFDLAKAAIEDAFNGPEWRCKAAVVLETVDQRKAKNRAEVAFKYADRTAKALEAELRAFQSVGASVRSMYSVAGRGES